MKEETSEELETKRQAGLPLFAGLRVAMERSELLGLSVSECWVRSNPSISKCKHTSPALSEREDCGMAGLPRATRKLKASC